MSENILIIYLNNGNFASQVTKEIMFDKAVNDLVNKGIAIDTTINTKSIKRAKFADGSKVEAIPILGLESSAIRGKKGITKIYLDDSILDYPESTAFIFNELIPCCRYDKNALMSYSVNEGELSVSKIFKEQ